MPMKGRTRIGYSEENNLTNIDKKSYKPRYWYWFVLLVLTFPVVSTRRFDCLTKNLFRCWFVVVLFLAVYPGAVLLLFHLILIWRQ